MKDKTIKRAHNPKPGQWWLMEYSGAGTLTKVYVQCVFANAATIRENPYASDEHVAFDRVRFVQRVS